MDDPKAKGLLYKMEEHIRTQQRSKDREPECEVHDETGSQSDLRERLDDVSSLGDLFAKQSHALTLLQERQPQTEELGRYVARSFDTTRDSDDFSASRILDQPKAENKSFDETVAETTKSLDDAILRTLQEISPTCVQKLNVNHHFIDNENNGHDFSQSETDTDSLFPDLDGTDSEIQAAINEIRKEASQMDAVMALDQLKTIQSELEVTSRALEERSTEAEDLRLQLEEMEDRVACLELERDLFKADASKLKEDLKTCVERMFDISCVVADSDMDEFNRNENSDSRWGHDVMAHTDGKPSTAKSPTALPKLVAEHAFPSLPPSRATRAAPSLVLAPKETRNAIRRSPTTSAPIPVQRMLLEASHRSPHESVNAQRDSIFRKPGSVLHRRPSSFQSTNTHRVAPNVDAQPPKRHRSFSVERRNPIASETEGKENRKCGIFRRRNSKRLSSSKCNDIEVMRQQISQLHSMMKTSLSTSEKLRKRISMISRYYEGIIRKLQEQVVETKTERKRMEVQLANQISTIDHEKRVTIMHLEVMLRRKDEEIARLRRREI